GAHSYRAPSYGTIPRGRASIRTLRRALRVLAGPGAFSEVVGGAFSRPSELLSRFPLSTERTQLVYYFGRVDRHRDGSLLMAQPSSTPGRPSTHVRLAVLFRAAADSQGRSTVIFLDGVLPIEQIDE